MSEHVPNVPALKNDQQTRIFCIYSLAKNRTLLRSKPVKCFEAFNILEQKFIQLKLKDPGWTLVERGQFRKPLLTQDYLPKVIIYLKGINFFFVHN